VSGRDIGDWAQINADDADVSEYASPVPFRQHISVNLRPESGFAVRIYVIHKIERTVNGEDEGGSVV
jgi:hypothetical protein